MPDVVKRFHRLYPNVHIQISSGQQPLALSPLRDGIVDMVVGPEPEEHQKHGLSFYPIVKTPVSVITGARSKWQGALRLEDLVKGDWVVIGTREWLPHWQQQFKAQGLEPPEIKVTSDSFLSALSIIQDSDYLCTYPSLILEKAMRDWRVVELHLDTPLIGIQISIITSFERPPTPAFEILLGQAQQTYCKTQLCLPEQ